FERAVGLVEARDAHAAGGERDAQPVRLGVAHAKIDVYLAVRGDAVAAVEERRSAVRPGPRLPLVDQLLLAGNSGRARKELDLPGRVLRERDGAAEGVEVVLEERLLGEALGSLHGQRVGHRRVRDAVASRRRALLVRSNSKLC